MEIIGILFVNKRGKYFEKSIIDWKWSNSAINILL